MSFVPNTLQNEPETNNFDEYLKENEYVDFSAPNIQKLCKELFTDKMTEREKLCSAFDYLRENVPHSFRVSTGHITTKASDTLKYKTGVCHAHSNLLCAVMRAEGIPAGLRFQRIVLCEEPERQYCIHCFNAVYIIGQWQMCDLSSTDKNAPQKIKAGDAVCAFENNDASNEYFYDGIYSEPDLPTMKMLENAKDIDDVYKGLIETEKTFDKKRA